MRTYLVHTIKEHVNDVTLPRRRSKENQRCDGGLVRRAVTASHKGRVRAPNFRHHQRASNFTNCPLFPAAMPPYS